VRGNVLFEILGIPFVSLPVNLEQQVVERAQTDIPLKLVSWLPHSKIAFADNPFRVSGIVIADHHGLVCLQV
jgi:hypothetical protein